ncbi:helix-turn-helix domain-containing protein [Jidongwangia harbinensis]|uniref:helix-turn-helix domain-containing protein n=1 Tax=Jidongwangia harbinensis TaxID=2878561 RepID=UPI001CD9CFC0|nr:helix-turn-helix domain-containing protein [Jidongwangia harbinensis]MCA2212034.1 helix-turn-helix domain-containing protein [Jidongwangia harbinensis]
MTAAFDSFRRRWAAVMGESFRLPAFTPSTAAGFRGAIPVARVHDVAISSVLDASAFSTATAPEASAGKARLWIVRRGTWTLRERRGVTRTVRAGEFLLHRGALERFGSAPHSSSLHLAMPAGSLAAPVTRGSVRTPEIRLVAAHAEMVRETSTTLGPAGLRAARDTLIELIEAVPRGVFDDAEPLLAPALAEAAKRLADDRLADPDLSAGTLAREFNVSVRTLQRAFARTGDGVASYLRDRRLERARRDVAAGGLTITEIAARWHFADGSHLSRAFRKRYGHPPSATPR